MEAVGIVNPFHSDRRDVTVGRQPTAILQRTTKAALARIFGRGGRPAGIAQEQL